MPSAVRIEGAWDGALPHRWQGTATAEEPFVGAGLLRQGAVVCWAKSKSATEHRVQLLLHPLDHEGSRVQPILYLGAAFLTQSIECRIPPAAEPPEIESACVVPLARPHVWLRFGEPATILELVFLAKSAVNVGCNHIWRPKPAAAEALPEPHRAALARGRAGRFSAGEA